MGLYIFIIMNSLIYSLLLSIILLGSLRVNPRMWLHPYPKEVRDKVEDKTQNEKKQFLVSGILFMIMMIGYPIISAIYMVNYYDIDLYLMITLYIFILFLSFDLVDTFIIDYVLFCLFTVDFIMVNGTEKKDYKDFKYHLKSGTKGLGMSIIFSLILALFI